MVVKFMGALLVALGLFALAACSLDIAPESPLSIAVSTPEVEPGIEPEIDEESVIASPTELVVMAQADLAERLATTVEQIAVREVREVTWPDASLGCPQPGMAYAQAVQYGLLIRLSVNGEMYLYHSGEAQKPFLCEGSKFVLPDITPKGDEFVPPPDSEID